MAVDQESFNKQLYELLRVRGYHPTPKNARNQNVDASQDADVIEFTFNKDGTSYGKAWASIDDAQQVIVYYDSEQSDSPEGKSPGVDYDDSWHGFLKHLKQWAQRKQLNFELANKDRLSDDMRQREYMRMKQVNEGYYPMGKQASYNDSVPTVKIILQHTRQIQEGEQRFRNVAKIFLENQEGERILAPTTRPGIAQVYARHLAEGGVPNDERWNHIKAMCEEYNKMAGFVRATKNGQFNESATALIEEGKNHYQNLRETLGKLRSQRGYNTYFESWTPALMEEEGDESVADMFVEETLDPRIESVMPILSRLRKNVSEMNEIAELEDWAETIVEADLAKEARNSSDYELYHDTYTSAINDALEYHAKRGLEVSEDDRWHHIAVNSKRPKDGETTRVQLPAVDSKGKKYMIDIQVYNRGTDRMPFELNTYASTHRSLQKEESSCVNEYDDYADDEQRFFIAIERENGEPFVGEIVKSGSRWQEMSGRGNKPNNWGSTYMGYLTPKDVFQMISQDYRNFEVSGPWDSEEEAYDAIGFADDDFGSEEEFFEDNSNYYEESLENIKHAISHRIVTMHLDVLKKHGPEKVLAAIENVAEFHADDEPDGDIGSSDISLMVRQVMRELGDDAELDEDLSPPQRKAGQLGPYDKVGAEGPVGKLVGESVDELELLKRLF